MIYRIREKFWSWGNDFSIKDAEGNDCFYVSGKVFSWGDNLSFQDNNRNELAQIKQKLMSWKPRYQVFIDGELYAEIIKEWSWFNKNFTLDVPGPNDYSIKGSFWSHEFEFMRGGRVVAQVSKKLWSWTDSYGIKILEEDNHVPILITCIVIDQVLYNQKKNA